MHVPVRAHYNPVSHTLDRKVHSRNHVSREISLLHGAQGHEGLSFPIFSFRMSNNFLNFLSHAIISRASSSVPREFDFSVSLANVFPLKHGKRRNTVFKELFWETSKYINLTVKLILRFYNWYENYIIK